MELLESFADLSSKRFYFVMESLGCWWVGGRVQALEFGDSFSQFKPASKSHRGASAVEAKNVTGDCSFEDPMGRQPMSWRHALLEDCAIIAGLGG